MALDIYFREDLENATNALEMAAMYQDNPDFWRGWLACCNAFRLAFGLEVNFAGAGKMLTVEAREVEA